jgi:MFS transporter, DHA2 family, multidrug resistance protein
MSATTSPTVPVTGGPPPFAAMLPVDLSHSPVLGIAGVILGAGIVTLAGRLLTLGLADLKGNVGIGFDEGAWISSAFNVALMFIGPLTVYFGALLGTRPVLLVCAGVFTLVSLGLPLVHSYSLLIVLLAIAGLTAGTFYPLTLSFALRNIPLRYLPITIALYAMCIEGAVNFAPSLYGFQRDHLSWAWMFWTSATVTPVMMACIYFGIPDSPRPARSGPAPSFVGFFYASAGLALWFAALDQGQRLDWWRSGVFTALVTAGTFFLLCAVIRRMRAPNPLVDLPYLRNWNTIILGFGLAAFRFCLLATIVIIPQSLSLRGLDAAQFGPAVLWAAVAEVALAALAAQLLNKGVDSRLLMAVGFVTIAFTCVLNADYTSAWAAENYFRSELLIGVGQIFAMVGLVGSIILQVMFSGGLDSPYRVLTFSAFFHVVRLFGGQAGVALMGHFIAEREKLHSFLLGLHVQAGNWITADTVTDVARGLAAKSSGMPAAAGRAIGFVSSSVRLQAYALSFIDAFHFVAWTCFAILLLTATLRRFPQNYRDLRASSRP